MSLFSPEDGAEVQSLAEWGVPHSLVPYSEWPSGEFPDLLGPSIELPHGWGPGVGPSIEDVNRGLRLGMGLVVQGDTVFDFGLIEPEALARMTGLECWGEWGNYEEPQLIALMTSLVEVSTPRLDEYVALDKLSNLRSATLRGSGALSGASAPRLERVTIEVPKGSTAGLKLSPSITSIALEASRPDLEDVVAQCPALRIINLYGIDEVDLSSLRLLHSLEELKIFGARRVTSIAALKDCSALRELTMLRVSSVDDPSAILSLELRMFEGGGRAFDLAFAQVVQSRRGWSVSAAKQRGGRVPSPLVRRDGLDGRVEIVMQDIGWITDRLGRVEVDEQVDSALAESLISAHIDANWPDALRSGVIEIDAEGSSVEIVVPNTETALQVQSSLDHLFGSLRELRKAVRRAIDARASG